jgi:hypothetical protein
MPARRRSGNFLAPNAVFTGLLRLLLSAIQNRERRAFPVPGQPSAGLGACASEGGEKPAEIQTLEDDMCIHLRSSISYLATLPCFLIPQRTFSS